MAVIARILTSAAATAVRAAAVLHVPPPSDQQGRYTTGKYGRRQAGAVQRQRYQRRR